MWIRWIRIRNTGPVSAIICIPPCLRVCARVPVGVKDDDSVRTGQVHTQSAHLVAQTTIIQSINRARVQVRVKDDDLVRTSQVHTQSTHLIAKQQ
jgi:hypothetical protein